MSSMHPPGWPAPIATPGGPDGRPGAGQLVAVGATTSSIAKGRFGKALSNDDAVVVSVHVAASGDGDVNFTSFCFRQVYGFPPCPTWAVWAASALARPLTPSQPPKRLSKLWFSW